MVDPHTHGCLEPEVVAAYADHGLSLAERARVERHLASCPQCTSLLAGVVRTVADVAAFLPDTGVAEATPPWTRRAGLRALAAAAAVIAVVTAPALVGPWLARDTGLVSLVGSVGEQRSVLGRLTGGFPHAPLDEPSAGGQGGRAAEADRVLLTAGRIRESFGDYVSPSEFHTLGVTALLAGQYDEAAQALLAASREQPANARYLNDVATVQLERARLNLRPDDLPRALAAADRATRLDPSLREAWFNRALAMTALSLTDQAKAAWAEYLRRDGASPWAGEARARLAALQRPTPTAAWAALEGRLQQSIDAATADEAVRTQTTEARNFIEQTLFVAWANAVLAGGTGAAELDRARVMAEAMLRVAGDALYRDTVEHLDRTAGHSRPIAEAFRTYAAAAGLVSLDRFAEAAPGMALAHGQLAEVNSPAVELAALGLGTIAYVQGRYDESDPMLAALGSRAATRSYAYAEGRAAWLRGLAAINRGRLAEAQAFYERGLALFERAGDIEQAAGVHVALASLHYLLGDRSAEWHHRRAAFEALPSSRSPRLRHSVLTSAAASVRLESPEAALVIQADALTNAVAWGRESATVELLAQQGTTFLALGRLHEASQRVREARERLSRVTDPSFRTLLELPVLLAESDVQRAAAPLQASATAERGVEIATVRGDRGRLPSFYLRVAKGRLAANELGPAERALAAGIEAFDGQRARLNNETAVSAFDEGWQLFETSVRLAIRKGDHDRAFALSERARATSVTEQRRAAPVSTLAAAQQVVRPDEAIVALNQFDDELTVWVIRRHGAFVQSEPLTRQDAQRLIARLQQDILTEAGHSPASAALFDAVVRPVSNHLAGVSRIIFVPDATYQDASFAALWNKSTQRFLVEDFRLANAPSVGAVSAASPERTGRPTARALIVGRSDVASVLAANARPRVTTLTAPTADQFLDEAAASTLVHVAAPFSSSASFPLLSRLTLNEQDAPGSTIVGTEIVARRWPATELVVLERAATSYIPAVGSFGLARAFLAAGVPAVLGTLPGASENATRDLMLGFHREMAAEVSATEALTRLQRNALQQNGRRLGAWTALVLYGSDR